MIKGFKNKVFLLYYNEAYEYQIKRQREIEEEEQEEKQRPTKDDLITLNKHITDEEKNIYKELFKNFQRPSDMLRFSNKTNDKEKNNELVNVINSGLKDFIKLTRRYLKKKE